MRYKFISRENNNRLILIYAGWGMDWRVFRHMRRHGYDIIIVWDYRQLTFDWSVVASYDEICLVAWSMGVFAASVTIHEILPRITKSIAVGGTPDPISDTLGIPVEIYRGTAEGLNAGNLRKFHRRMCLDAGHYSAFREVAPRRDISSLRDELYALETHTIFHALQLGLGNHRSPRPHFSAGQPNACMARQSTHGNHRRRPPARHAIYHR